MKGCIYKSGEESRLIKSLSQSQLISKQELLEIKSLYNEEVPYHNFLHALKVAEGVLKLPRIDYNIIEVQSLFISALFHDAWHTGTAEDLDEFRSLDMAFQWIIDFEKKYNYRWIDYSIVRKSIIWTVFKNRAQNKDKYAILLADLDVSTVWMTFPEFLYYADFPFSVECWINIEKWLSDLNYFKFLMWIEKNIFRTEKVRKIFPEYLSNIKKYTQVSANQITELYNYWKDNDITYSEFEEKYKKMAI
jgi:hypothetical protein